MSTKVIGIDAYKDKAGGWRWRMRSTNGKIIADGAEGYSKRSNLFRALRSLERLLALPIRINWFN